MTRTVLIGLAGAVIVVIALLLNDGLNRTPDEPETAGAGTEAADEEAASVDAEGDAGAPDAAEQAAETAEKVAEGLSGETSGESAGVADSDGDGAPDTPEFDVVRISKDGDTVFAGRAPPGSEVTIYDGDEPIGTVTADERGEWVYLPSEPLAPGSHDLSLVAKLPGEGGKTVESGSKVVLVVPEQGKDIAGRPTARPQAPLAMLVPRNGGTNEGVGARVLQKPSVPGSVESEAGDLALDSVDYDAAGNVSLGGRGLPGAEVRAYLDNELIGRAEVPPTGLWRITPEGTVEPGPYTLRLDMVDPAGEVTARVELPFSRAEPMDEFTSNAFVVVQPGNSLWRIARRTMESGFKYTVIYEANKDQIRDPDLIYPGQIFEVPAN